MERVTSSAHGIVYNAEAVSRILGLGTLRSGPVPVAGDGEIVIYYGGWNLTQLRLCAVGKKHMYQHQCWYDRYKWATEPGYYRILLPVLGSGNMAWSEQIALLQTNGETWQPAPITIAAAALVILLAETENDLLKGGWCRCAESLADCRRVGLNVDGGHVYAHESIWDGNQHDSLTLAAAQKC